MELPDRPNWKKIYINCPPLKALCAFWRGVRQYYFWRLGMYLLSILFEIGNVSDISQSATDFHCVERWKKKGGGKRCCLEIDNNKPSRAKTSNHLEQRQKQHGRSLLNKWSKKWIHTPVMTVLISVQEKNRHILFLHWMSFFNRVTTPWTKSINS